MRKILALIFALCMLIAVSCGSGSSRDSGRARVERADTQSETQNTTQE